MGKFPELYAILSVALQEVQALPCSESVCFTAPYQSGQPALAKPGVEEGLWMHCVSRSITKVGSIRDKQAPWAELGQVASYRHSCQSVSSAGVQLGLYAKDVVSLNKPGLELPDQDLFVSTDSASCLDPVQVRKWQGNQLALSLIEFVR